MNSTTISTPRSPQTGSDRRDADILAFHRFMIWAYEESENTFEDEFLRAAIHTIIYYLDKHYDTDSGKTH